MLHLEHPQSLHLQCHHMPRLLQPHMHSNSCCNRDCTYVCPCTFPYLEIAPCLLTVAWRTSCRRPPPQRPRLRRRPVPRQLPRPRLPLLHQPLWRRTPWSLHSQRCRAGTLAAWHDTLQHAMGRGPIDGDADGIGTTYPWTSSCHVPLAPMRRHTLAATECR